MEMSRLTRDGNMPNPERARQNSLGANGDREIFIFPVQLTTSRIGKISPGLSLLLLHVMTIYIHRRYFQHAHFIPIVGVGKRGEY